MSLQRFLKIESLLKLNENKKDNFNANYLKKKIFWKLFRLLLTTASLLFSLLLGLAGCDDSFRVYCKRKDLGTG
jgi:hypothetical protein